MPRRCSEPLLRIDRWVARLQGLNQPAQRRLKSGKARVLLPSLGVKRPSVSEREICKALCKLHRLREDRGDIATWRRIRVGTLILGSSSKGKKGVEIITVPFKVHHFRRIGITRVDRQRHGYQRVEREIRRKENTHQRWK